MNYTIIQDTKVGKGRRFIFLIFASAFFLALPLHAQENPALVVELVNRVGALEVENRELRGQLEETRHELTALTQRMETLSADVDYRLNNPESGALLAPGVTPSAGPAIASKGASTATEDYEKARALLEQGDYGAAERAFLAFMAAYPKDELAGAAQYWLGVTYFVRGEYETAASTFAKGYKNYPKSSKAADNLLKLAKSLSALDRKADACTALSQLAAEHPNAHVNEVASERQKNGCK